LLFDVELAGDKRDHQYRHHHRQQQQQRVEHQNQVESTGRRQRTTFSAEQTLQLEVTIAQLNN